MFERDRTVAVFKKYNESASLYRHALAVESVMRHFAEKRGEDVLYWGAVGLLHDIDYERFPEQHCAKAAEILAQEGFDAAFIHAVVSHGYGLVSQVPPELPMEKILFATDDLTGLVAAAALMLPTKQLSDLKLSSLKKKWKDKRFAAGVNRDIIAQGAEMTGMPLDDLMTETMTAMTRIMPE